jgi:hypothetical protein
VGRETSIADVTTIFVATVDAGPRGLVSAIPRAAIGPGGTRIRTAPLLRAAGFGAALRILTSIVASAPLMGSLQHTGLVPLGAGGGALNSWW